MSRFALAGASLALALLAVPASSQQPRGRGGRPGRGGPGGRTAAAKPGKLNLLDEAFKQISWRSIGPATMGGRVADIAVNPKDDFTFYVALGTGGLIKTDSNGGTWQPLFDSQPVASVGAVAVAPSNPDIVWAGTGEANGRNSSSWGDGVYKSTDGGKTWSRMGLEDTQEIGRIVIDPSNADVVWVAAAGHLWGPNPERGVYVTHDGGKTWTQSLKVDENTGAIDIALTPGGGPLFAAMYARRRLPWGFNEFGPGAGLFRSTNGGSTWQRVTNGIPSGNLGRIGVAVSPSKPSVVYALVEAERGGGSLEGNDTDPGGLFRSDDGGATFKRQSGRDPRPFYFSQVRVDPKDENHVFVLGTNMSESKDGGKTWTPASRGVHSDLHALWIDPQRPAHMLVGCDGGAYASFDGAKHWMAFHNFPEGEFYEVAVDNRAPFHVYGGLQDNSCWTGPSATMAGAGPANADWKSLVGGDGFYAVPDPTDPEIIYAESQNAGLERIDQHTNKRESFTAPGKEGEPSHRFNWDTPIAIDPFTPDTVYVGGERLFTWTKKGTAVAPISPDLSKQVGSHITTAGSGAEVYGTIVTVAPSPLTKGVIWCGTDDGNVQVTRDGGEHWKDVSGGLPHGVRDMYVTRVVASSSVPGRAWASLDGHRNDEFAPHLFQTDDYGASWRSISGDLPKHGPVKAFREDPVNPALYFCGTEFGGFASLDGGEHWRSIKGDMPTVSVNDYAIQKRDHALVAATHGRSLFVDDNIALLEDLTPATLSSDAHLFPVPTTLERQGGFFGGFGGNIMDYAAPNPEPGAAIVYWQKNLSDEPASITITNSEGKTVGTIPGDRFPGLKTLRWEPRVQQAAGGFQFGPPRRRFGGADFLPPGEYTVTLTIDKFKQSQKVSVLGPTGSSTPTDDGGEAAGGEPRR